MKITEVRAVQPISPSSPPDWRTTFGQILIAIDTDVGITGYGVGGGGQPGVFTVATILRDVLLGEDPRNIEALWQKMYQSTLAFGRKGIAIMALSGVDLALWDLCGKAEKLPVASLLGAKSPKAIPTYLTVWDTITEALASQHSAFKLHLGKILPFQPTLIIERVALAREILGHEKMLMADAWMKWTVAQTLELILELHKHNLAWIEEPLGPDDVAGYIQLRDQSPIPIAGGEHEFTEFGFEPLIEHRLHTILQPDICWCGGMTSLIKIYEMAGKHGLRVCPHRGAEPWGLHAITALDSQPLAESGRLWLEWVQHQPQIKNQMVCINDAPGFGVHIDEDHLPFKG